MLVVVVAVEGMKVSVMKIICMPFVTKRGVPAVRAVLMRMTLMFFAAHMFSFLVSQGGLKQPK